MNVNKVFENYHKMYVALQKINNYPNNSKVKEYCKNIAGVEYEEGLEMMNEEKSGIAKGCSEVQPISDELITKYIQI